MSILKSTRKRILQAIKAVGSSRKSQAITGAAVVAIISGSILLVQNNAAHNRLAEQKRQAGIAQAQQLQDSQEQVATLQASKTKESTASTSAATHNPASTPSSTTQTKYATSSDPRSMAYSTTPPASHQADVNITITQAGQVSAGTLISYNSAKGEKTYYGGDLVLSSSVITISKSAPYAGRNITVSVPDGQTIGMPSEPWNDHNGTFYLTMEASKAKDAGTSFDMFIDGGYTAANGTYKLHMTSHRTAQTADGWQYDGFITINLVD